MNGKAASHSAFKRPRCARAFHANSGMSVLPRPVGGRCEYRDGIVSGPPMWGYPPLQAVGFSATSSPSA